MAVEYCILMDLFLVGFSRLSLTVFSCTCTPIDLTSEGSSSGRAEPESL